MSNNKKISISDIKLKELIATIDVNALNNTVNIPRVAMLKGILTTYAYEDGKRTDTIASQTLNIAHGNTLADIEIVDVQYTGTPILDDNADALIGTMIMLNNISLAPIANMLGRDFKGFSAVGIKLIVGAIAPARENK